MQSDEQFHVDCHNDVDQKSFAVRYFGARHTQILLLALATTITFAIRVSISVGLVAMTTPNSSPNPDVPTYVWTDKSIVLSSYYWGYVLLQVLAGQLAKKYGPKWSLGVTACIASLISILIPFVAHFGSWAVIVCRVIQGLCHGFLLPSCHTMLSKWVPVIERARLSAFVYSSGFLGTAISMTLTGLISGTWAGWPYAFYGHGAVGLLWTLLWIIVAKNSPKDHSGIDPDERLYIERSLKHTTDKPIPTPWKSIFTSMPVLSILIAMFGEMWGFSTLFTNIPRYSASILGYSIEDNGILSAMPYLTYWIISFFFSFATDYLISRRITSTKLARRIMSCIGLYMPGAMLMILATLIRLDANVADGTLAMFIIAVASSAATLSGYTVNHIDIAPAHAGTLMGITNGFANIGSIIAPLIVQFIVFDETDATQWSIVFYISAAFYILTCSFYLAFSSFNTQTWNNGNVET